MLHINLVLKRMYKTVDTGRVFRPLRSYEVKRCRQAYTESRHTCPESWKDLEGWLLAIVVTLPTFHGDAFQLELL